MVWVMSASLVSPTELSPEMEAVLGTEARLEPMSVVARQEKLLEKLSLDGLTHWSQGNAVAVRELVLAYHDVFALEGNELGCTSAIEHEICVVHQQDRLLSGQLCPAFPPAWKECGAIWLQADIVH